jgi:hypothetical protein
MKSAETWPVELRCGEQELGFELSSSRRCEKAIVCWYWRRSRFQRQRHSGVRVPFRENERQLASSVGSSNARDDGEREAAGKAEDDRRVVVICPDELVVGGSRREVEAMRRQL